MSLKAFGSPPLSGCIDTDSLRNLLLTAAWSASSVRSKSLYRSAPMLSCSSAMATRLKSSLPFLPVLLLGFSMTKEIFFSSASSLFSSFFLSMPSRPSTENFTTLSLGVLIRTLPLLAAHKQWPSGSHSFKGDSTKPSLRRRYLEVLPSHSVFTSHSNSAEISEFSVFGHSAPFLPPPPPPIIPPPPIMPWSISAGISNWNCPLAGANSRGSHALRRMSCPVFRCRTVCRACREPFWHCGPCRRCVRPPCSPEK
mmetsp:Transcript_35229/g.82150  ORF Transcript_35229/g.82150 Transcript_35229/m.82150 type:complete len:254 (+) Transcript_35229:1218-1979(+)